MSAINCPHCNGAFQITPDFEGQQLTCPHCNGVSVVPRLASPSPVAPATDWSQYHRDQSTSFFREMKSLFKMHPGKSWTFGIAIFLLCSLGSLSLLVSVLSRIRERHYGQQQNQNVDSGQRNNQKPTLREFEEIVIGKTAEEVIEAVGKPDGFSRPSFGDQWYYYRNMAIDPVTGRATWASLSFDGATDRGAKVKSVDF